MDPAARYRLAEKRLTSVLTSHTVALARTLEQKISDGGPMPQRIDPHILTNVRRKLQKAGVIRQIQAGRTRAAWYHLRGDAPDILDVRLNEQLPIHHAVSSQSFTRRAGQALEIAVSRALDAQDSLEHFGYFTDLDQHDDSKPYSKEEPPSAIGHRRLPGNLRLDFLARHSDAATGWAAIEVKNVREWIYPDRVEIKDLLLKATVMDAIPVLIARRIPYVTYHLLQRCGVILWQTYRQRYPVADTALADNARHKRLLGFHDIQTGNEAGPHLTRFLHELLPKLLPDARVRYDKYFDLVRDFGHQYIPYEEFAARVRRRAHGLNEDFDEEGWLG